MLKWGIRMHFDHTHTHQTTFSFESSEYLWGSHVDVVVSQPDSNHICSYALNANANANTKGLCYFWHWRLLIRCHFVFKFPYSRKFTTLFAWLFACINWCLACNVHIFDIWVCVKHLNVNCVLWFESVCARETNRGRDRWGGRGRATCKFEIFLVTCFTHRWLCVMQMVTPNSRWLGNVEEYFERKHKWITPLKRDLFTLVRHWQTKL